MGSRCTLPADRSLLSRRGGGSDSGSWDDVVLNVRLGTLPPAPSLREGECACGDAAGLGVMVSGVNGRADMVGSFPQSGWMIQEGKWGKDGEMKRWSGRGCAAGSWGEGISVRLEAQQRCCAHEVGFTMSVADALSLQSQAQWHGVGATQSTPPSPESRVIPLRSWFMI